MLLGLRFFGAFLLFLNDAGSNIYDWFVLQLTLVVVADRVCLLSEDS